MDGRGVRVSGLWQLDVLSSDVELQRLVLAQLFGVHQLAVEQLYFLHFCIIYPV